MKNFILFIALIIFNDAHASGKNSAMEKMDSDKIEYLKKNIMTKEQQQKTAKEFESVAVTKMLQNMYEGVKVDPIFGNSSTEGIYKDLLLIEYGKIIAENGGIGLADSILNEMNKMEGKNVQHSPKN